MEEILKYRKPLYGLLALWIIIFHIESTVGLPCDIPIITSLIQSGNICVDVFLIISGYCCCLSYKSKPSPGIFYERRFLRVALPYLILAIPFYLWKTLTHYQEFSLSKRILFFGLDLSGISLFTNGVLTTWFVTAIILFYFLFPIVFYIVEKAKSWFTASLVLVLIYVIIMIVIHSLIPGVYRKGGIAFTRFPIFCIGSICAYYSLLPVPKKKACILSSLFILLFLGLIPVRNLLDALNAGREFYWLIYILFTIPLTYSLYALIRVIPSGIKDFLSFCGVISLELYIVHIIIRNVLVWYSITPQLGFWLYLLLPLVSIPIAFCVFNISNRIRDILSR